MKYTFRVFVLMFGILFMPVARAQNSPSPLSGLPTKTTFVPLRNNANAVLVEPVTPIPEKSRIAVLVTHPERINNFNYFTGLALSKYGYRAMMLNNYGNETSYYELLAPIAAAIKALRATAGVEKVVLVGHSTGGPELTAYQDVAENGPAACQGADRVYKCETKDAENLPKADGIVLFDANTGAPDRTLSLNPAVDEHHPRQINPDLDMFNPKNEFDPSTGRAAYSDEFLKKFYAAKAAKANRVIDEALARLALIEKGEGQYKDDEPFVVAGGALRINGARAELADTRLLSRTHAPHLLLKPDGTMPVQVIPRITVEKPQPQLEDMLYQTTFNVTVRHYLSTQALRVTEDFRATPDNVLGVKWRSTPNSLQGNLEGIRVPTLVLSGTCSIHMVLLEIAYDHSAAKDKEFVGVEGANHGFTPCGPEYGDTFKRAFDFADSWLSKPGRF